MATDHQRLLDIRDTIDQIEKKAARGKMDFEADLALQSQLFDDVQQIAEATRMAFSNHTQQLYSEVDWSRIESMQSYLEYREVGIDPEILWLSIEQEIPALKQQISIILEKVETQVG
jgi:uncharacterized protein with HEPN domain